MQRVAFSREIRMVPRGRAGMSPKDAPHALHFRRALPSRSLPHPIVRPPQVRQAIGAGVRFGASMAFGLDRVSIAYGNTNVKGLAEGSSLTLHCQWIYTHAYEREHCQAAPFIEPVHPSDS